MKQLSQKVYDGYNQTKYPLFHGDNYMTRDELEDYIEKYLLKYPKLALVYFKEKGKDIKLLYGENVSAKKCKLCQNSFYKWYYSRELS